jgi:rhodanese-related sulfurtransferase
MFGFNSGCRRLSMQEAKQEMSRADIRLIDVRSPEEYRQGHIQGSVNIPLDRLPANLTRQVPDKNTPVFVYCLSGARSQSACRWMAQNGYNAVTNIGGISDWSGPVSIGDNPS